MQIRPIQVSDIERFTELWNRVYAEGKYLRSPAPDKDTLTNILRRVAGGRKASALPECEASAI